MNENLGLSVPAAGTPPARRSILPALGVAALILAHLALGVGASWEKSATFDENTHIGSGFSFWATGDFRLGPEAVLAQRWLALPVFLSGTRPPPQESRAWRIADFWNHSYELLYRDGSDGMRPVRSARAANAILSALLALVTFLWARALFGAAGGAVALALYAFFPTTLALAGLATPDVSAALAITASMAALWRAAHLLTLPSLALCCLAVGLAVGTKSSALLLLPMGLLAASIRIGAGGPLRIRIGGRERVVAGRGGQAAAMAGIAVAACLAAWVVLWGAFNFRYERYRDPAAAGEQRPFSGDWPEVMARLQAPRAGQRVPRRALLARFVQIARERRLLPEAYLFAQASGVAAVESRFSFLDGKFSPVGFAAFFPACVLYKTPLAVFLLLVPAVSLLVVRRFEGRASPGKSPRDPWGGWYGTVPLWCLLAVYWWASVSAALNIGVRHILPTFPATFVLMGAGGLWFSRASAAAPPGFRRLQRLLVAAGLIWLLVGTLAAFPNYIAYFGAAAGGSRNGYRHLVDSSLDWGQDLPGLARWLERERGAVGSADLPRVYLSLFGSTPPGAHGVRGTWLPSFFPIELTDPPQARPVEPELEAGIYCISATMLQSVYNLSYPGPWRVDYERDYRELSRLARSYFERGNGAAAGAEKIGPTGAQEWDGVLRRFDAARFGRLCAHLRNRAPDDSVNHSILVYRLSAEELRQALHGPPAEARPRPDRFADPVSY